MPITMQSAAIAVTAPAFNPYLLAGPIEVERGGAWPAYMESGAITIGTGLQLAKLKDPTQVYEETPIFKVNGNAIANEWIASAPSWQEDRDSPYGTFTVQVPNVQLGMLDFADADADATFTIDMHYRYADTGETSEERIFTGRCKAAGDDESADAPGGMTTLQVWDMNGEWDRERITKSYNLETAPYGCVIFNYLDECEPLAMESVSPFTASTDTIRISAGAVLIDRRNIGGFGMNNPPWPFQGTGNTRSGGGIVRVEIAQRDANLVTLGAVITDPAQLGLISVFVANNGRLTAVNGQSPPGAVNLCTIDLQYVGQSITEQLITDARDIAVPLEYRTRGEILRIVLEDMGVDVTTFFYPSVYNDDVSCPIAILDQPFGEFARQWCEPSLWRFHFDRDGNPRVWVDRIVRAPAPVKWEFHQQNVMRRSTASPDKAYASADVTIRGVNRKNLGLPERVEKRTVRDYAPLPTGEGTATQTMHGTRSRFGGETSNDIKLIRKTEYVTTYRGNSVVSEERKTWVRRNPINYRTDILDRIINQTWDSPECGFDFMFEDQVLMLDEVTRTIHVYEGRVYRGWEKSEKRVFNPVTHGKGVGFETGGGSRNLDYGFKSLDEALTLVSLIQFKVTPTRQGFIDTETTTEWALYNPPNNGELSSANIPRYGWGGAQHGLRGEGVFSDEEQLMKVSESIVRYRKRNEEEIEIHRATKSWEKKSKATATGLGDRFRTGGSLGHTQSVSAGAQSDIEIRKGTLPVVASIEDMIERTPVGARVYSPSLISAHGLSHNVINEEHPYCETAEMCQRLATWRMADGLSYDWTLLVSLAAGLKLGDPASVVWHTQGRRTYSFRSVVTSIAPALALEPNEVASLSVRLGIDRNDINATLGGRT